MAGDVGGGIRDSQTRLNRSINTRWVHWTSNTHLGRLYLPTWRTLPVAAGDSNRNFILCLRSQISLSATLSMCLSVSLFLNTATSFSGSGLNLAHSILIHPKDGHGRSIVL